MKFKKLVKMFSITIALFLFASVQVSAEGCTYLHQVTAIQLNIRDQPNTSGRVIGVLHKDDQVCISKESGDWGKTNSGWVSKKHLALLDNTNQNSIQSEGEIMEWYYWIGLIIIGWIAIKIFVKNREEKRYRKIREELISSLMEKYNDSDIVEKIMNGEYWLDMTEEQLVDSLKNPEDIDEKVTRTKTIETWKYGEIGKNRYKLKIKLENGIVTGWDNQ